MSEEELIEFDNVVFNIENPQLKRYLVMNEALRPEHRFPIMHRLQEYVQKRKEDYAGNIPKPGQTPF